jgi:hypothetical protein
MNTMTGLILKLILMPLTIVAADYLLPGLTFSSIYQPIVVGLIIAAIGHAMEIAFLKNGTIWINNFLDFVAAAAVLYFSPTFLSGVTVTLGAAMIVALFIGLVEYFQHMYFVKSGKAQS